MSIAARLDRLHLLFNNVGGTAADCVSHEGHLRLESIQKCWLFTVAGK